MTTPFKAMAFVKNDVITKDSMDAVQANLQWLQTNTPRGRMNREGNKPTDLNTVIISGRVHIARSKKSASAVRPVRLGRAFAPHCNPNVSTGIISDSTPQVFCVVNGPGRRLIPDNTGFEIRVTLAESNNKAKWKIAKPIFVCWQAFGYRLDDMNDF